MMLTCETCKQKASRDLVALFDYCPSCKTTPFQEDQGDSK